MSSVMKLSCRAHRHAQAIIIPIIKKETDREPVTAACKQLVAAAKAAGLRVKVRPCISLRCRSRCVGARCVQATVNGCAPCLLCTVNMFPGDINHMLHEPVLCDTLCCGFMHAGRTARTGAVNYTHCLLQPVPCCRWTPMSVRRQAGSTTTGRCGACLCVWRWGPKMWSQTHASWHAGTWVSQQRVHDATPYLHV